MNSGWAARSGSVAAYRNVGADGLQHFPGFSQGAVEWLVAERDIAGIGVDTLSLDPGRSQTFDAHVAVLGADRYGIENLANLDQVPDARRHGHRRADPVGAGLGRPCPRLRPLVRPRRRAPAPAGARRRSELEQHLVLAPAPACRRATRSRR